MKQIDYRKLGYHPDCGSWDIKLDLTANEQYSAHGLSRLKSGYMREDEETPQHRLANIARLLSSDKAHAQRMYEYMSKMWYSPSTPQLAYGRTPLGQPIACYLPHLADTAESLVEVSNETKVMNMLGGGVGTFMNIRGAAGKSTGVMAHAKTYDADIVAYQQQGTRRGAVAVYLRMDHPDIEQFLRARLPGGDDKFKLHKAYQGVVIPKLFMEKLEALRKGGTTQAEKEELDKWELKHPAQGVTAVVSVRELAQTLISARIEHQQPYIMFEDNANGNDEWLYKETGHSVHHSNLCVAPDTLVLTDFGHATIAMLVGQEVRVWNGVEYSKVTPVQTGTDVELWELEFDDGSILKCTPYHKFYPAKDGALSTIPVPASELRLNSIHKKFKYDELGFLQQSSCNLKSITKGLRGDTYCFTEPLRGMGVFNGILTGNCSEIILSTSEKHSAVCCLGSVNIEKYDEWEFDLYQFIFDITEFLDNSITVFCRNIRGLGDEHRMIRESMMKAVRGAELERSIGIGMLGFHSYLQHNMIAFDNIAAVSFARKVQSLIHYAAALKSETLGKVHGVAPMFDLGVSTGKARRNVKLIAIAPNASSSIILNTSPSIEPYRANVYLEGGSVGNHTRWNKNLIAHLDTLGLSEEKLNEVKLSIIENQGSVQHLTDILSERALNVFKCAHEIDQMDLIRVAAARQEFVDQAQSLNLFLAPEVDLHYVADLHIAAWKAGLKTLYYCYRHSVGKVSTTVNAPRAINLDSACVACEG